jgi:hypothetical protein
MKKSNYEINFGMKLIPVKKEYRRNVVWTMKNGNKRFAPPILSSDFSLDNDHYQI